MTFLLATLFASTLAQASPPEMVMRIGGGVDIGYAVVGPSIGADLGLLTSNHWSGTIHTDFATRRFSVLGVHKAREIAVLVEAGRQIPLGPVGIQPAIGMGVTSFRHTSAISGCPILSNEPCAPSKQDNGGVRPDISGSIGLTNPAGNIWLGVRGRAIVPSAQLVLMVGPKPLAL